MDRRGNNMRQMLAGSAMETPFQRLEFDQH
jgi:hypothetical protein